MSIEPPDLSKPFPAGEHMAYLGLGSNAEPRRHLRRAIRRLREAVAVLTVSTAWESPAVGADGPNYVNAALLVRTPLLREGLMAQLKSIEDELGRVRARAEPAGLAVDIDIDMLVFDNEVLENDLWSQAYRAVPLAELVPDLSCPSTGESLAHAAARLAERSPIEARPEILPGLPRTGTSRSHPTNSTRTRTP